MLQTTNVMEGVPKTQKTNIADNQAYDTLTKREIFERISNLEDKISQLVIALERKLDIKNNSVHRKRNRSSYEVDLNLSDECYETIIEVIDEFTIQATESENTDCTEEQVNVGFEDIVNPGVTLAPVVPSLYNPTVSANSDIAKFLSRPVNIKTISWTIGGSISTNTTPMYDFLNHTSIKKKIDNYAFLRGDLHVKFMINASPFYYGAMLSSWHPVYGYESAISQVGDVLIPYSQRPHVYVYPQNCEGAEMVLPFIYPYEWLDLTSAAALTSYGLLTFSSMDVLRNANGVVAETIDIQIYAWLENVELAGLTVEVAAQSNLTEYDQAKGPVSKPASAIARATGLLSSVPVIGPFMTATSIGAGAISNIASLFGYSKVPVISNVVPMKNLPFHGLASSDISEPTEKLSIDSKNELTVNNKCLGDSEVDPLLLKNIATRPSYVTSFAWQQSDATDALLWNTYVTPSYSALTSSTDQTIVNGTPMWLVSQMFQYWRGDLIFDFKIICSQYHRGRVRFSWDPVGDIANTTNATTEVYNQIIDIQDTTNVSIRVPYNQYKPFMNVASDLSTVLFNTTALAVDTSDVTNGILTVRVFNELTSPAATAPITILVTVRGAENLEFAAPKLIVEKLNYFTVQSSETTIDGVKEYCFGEPSTVDPNINLVYMGEKIESLRSLTQRCNHSLTNVTLGSNSADLFSTTVMNRRPIFPGFDPNGIHGATGLTSAVAEPYNWVTNTPYHLLRQCFLGERGSITWKMNWDSTNDRSLTVSRNKTVMTALKYIPISTTLATTISNVSKIFKENVLSTSGGALINQKTNTGLSVNIPQYTDTSFVDTAPASAVLGSEEADTATDSFTVNCVMKEVIEDVDAEYLSSWFETGPDHSFYYFLAVPTMFLYDTVPTASVLP